MSVTETETTTEPTLNVGLVERALAQIERTPELWDQGAFIQPNEAEGLSAADLDKKGDLEVCDTNFCLAGWGMYLSGDWKPAIVKDGDEPVLELVDKEGRRPSDVYPEGHIEDSGYMKAGAVALGLTRDQARYLFTSLGGSGTWGDDDEAKNFTRTVREYLGLTPAESTK